MIPNFKNNNFLQAITLALKGIGYFLRVERNGQIQILMVLLVSVIAWLLNVSYIEWISLIICYTIVLMAEMMNTAIELLCNYVNLTYHPLIKNIKDVSAGAVLTCSIASMVIGCIIFIPKIIKLYN